MGRQAQAQPAPAPHFELSPKQYKALFSEAKVVVCGGGNGGGKSHTLRMLPLLPEYLSTPNCRSVLFAESNVKLEQADGMVDECKKLYGAIHPLGVGGYRQSPKKRWTWPVSAATIDLSYVGVPGQWDGLQAAVVGVDQVEQLSIEQFDSVTGRNRTMADVRPRIIVTANPPAAGKEHWLTQLLEVGGWIDKDGWAVEAMDGRVRYFIRSGLSYIFADTAEELLPNCKLGSDGKPVPPRSMTFVQMLVRDHPVAAFRQQYEETLSQLSEIEQLRRWDGNWHATETAGKYFKREFFPVLDHYEQPYFVRRVRSWDCAWSPNEGADWTPAPLMEQGSDNFVTVTDLIRFRGTQAHVERAVKLVAELDGPGVIIRLPKDAGLAGFAQSELARWLGAHGYTVTLTADKGDKLTRSKPYQARAERREIRLTHDHSSAGVAELLTKDFEVFNSEGQKVIIKGLPQSNVSTLKDWHSSWYQDHVLFGRDTLKDRRKKKDVVDAAVGGNDVLTSDPADPADVDDEQIKREFAQARAALGGREDDGGIGFGGCSGSGSPWL